MTRTTLRRTLLVAGLLLVAGCESDAAKLDRLRTAEAIAALGVLGYERKIERTHYTDSTAIRALYDSLSTERTELDLVRRDINRLLR